MRTLHILASLSLEILLVVESRRSRTWTIPTSNITKPKQLRSRSLEIVPRAAHLARHRHDGRPLNIHEGILKLKKMVLQRRAA